MKRYEQLYYNKIYKKKYILLLDSNYSGRKNSYNSFDNNIKRKEILDRGILKKNIFNKKKFKKLRNFSSKFQKRLLTLESPHKSNFAKRILSEIIPPNLSKKNVLFKKRKIIYKSNKNLLILNTPKANNSFYSNKIFQKDSKSQLNLFNENSIKKRNSQSINLNYFYLFKVKKPKISKAVSLMNFSTKTEPTINDSLIDKGNKDGYIQDIITEDNDNDNINSEENKFIGKKENYNISEKEKLKINLRKIPFKKPKKLIFNNKNNKNIIAKRKINVIKKNMISKSITPQKLYSKKCDMKKHYCHEKFVNKFLTPINKFMNTDFQLTNNEYEKINKKIHDSNYLINNNEYSVFINKRKKEKYKKFLPPKIPNIHNIIENKYFSIINELNNYKFKI